jgi:rare lipoprotein A
MRPQPLLRARRPMAVGALGFATLAAGASAVAQAQNDQDAIDFKVHDRALRHGQTAKVTGRVPDGRAGVPVALEFRAAGQSAWRTLGDATTREAGRFRLTGRPPRSGELRVTAGGGFAPTARSSSSTGGTPAATGEPSAVAVHARLVARRVRADVLAGRTAQVRGVLRPAQGDRTVALQARRGGKWRTLDRDTTNGGGAYALSYKTNRTGSWKLRVQFSGDDANARTRRGLGRLDVYRRARASWYGPGLYGNSLSCGGRLSPGTLGVAHKTLPCGTKVTFRHRGRSVRVRVVDRGPYVGGREYDLTAAVKRRLGFEGHGTVWSTK